MIKGIDISEHQGNVRFEALKPNIDFIVVRSSYGTGKTDKWFANNRDAVRNLNIPHGFYHYAYPNLNDPESEADWFCQVVGTPQEGEFMCLDFEENYPDPVGWSKRFLDRLSANLKGYKPLIYLNLNLVQTHDWKPVVDGGYGLWLALWDYDPNGASFDTPWSVVAMRQYSNREKYPGVTGGVDANVFYGDVKVLAAYGYHPPLSTIEGNQFETLNRKVDSLQKTVDDTNSGLASDRSDIDKLKTDQATINAQQSVIIKRIEDLEKNMKVLIKDSVNQAVTEALAPMQKNMKDMQTQLNSFVQTPPKYKKIRVGFFTDLLYAIFRRESKGVK